MVRIEISGTDLANGRCWRKADVRKGTVQYVTIRNSRMFHNASSANRAHLKNALAASSPSSTVAETADTTTILIRFCATIDAADAAAGGGFAFVVSLAFLRFGFWDVVFAAIAFPRD